MNPVVTRIAASIGVAFLVLALVQVFVPNLSIPVALGIGFGSGVVLGILDKRRAKRSGRQTG